MKERGQLTFSSLYHEMTKSDTLKEISKDILPLFKAAACFLSGQETSGIGIIIRLMADGAILDSGVRIINAAKRKAETSWNDHVLRMRGAYASICFTAFFDTLRQILPKTIYNEIALQEGEKKLLWENADAPNFDLQALDVDLVLPDLVFNCNRVYEYLETLYSNMAKSLQLFVHNLAFSEEAQEKDIRIFEEQVKKLPKTALNSFKSQYLILCSTCPEFYIYIQIGKELEIASDIEEKYHSLLTLATRTETSLTTGLCDLNKAISACHEQYKTKKALSVAQSLIDYYQTALQRPVVKTTEDENLRFPSIADSFIPQQFRLLLYSGRERLEQRSTWENCEVVEDMNSFWVKYLLNTESVESLLLILGEPGSGKSLLTEVLAAEISSEASLAVRVSLRKASMESSIENIVCAQLNKDGDPSEKIDKLRWLTEELNGEPITLIFDGYDEVQQATGASYRTFLNDLKVFQQECLQHKRPVRIVITSRMTLIDKTDIPHGTTVMKLEEFNSPRITKWIEDWNRKNHAVFVEAGINDFALPAGKEIIELAKQPLLLLMLAIYDADFESGDNALMRSETSGMKLDRTQLYDKLLRRFISRELKKGQRGSETSFLEANNNERAQMIDSEMKKLGIAALGMFIREKLYITVEELETDFNCFDVQHPRFTITSKSRLRNEEIFLGSFFFIHDSRERNKNSNDSDSENQYEPNAAFVFLHKTFYEFLAADFILQNYFEYLIRLCSKKYQNEDLYHKELEQPSDMFDSCFIALNGACLCVEPEILQMIGEWKGRKLLQCQPSDKTFEETTVISVIKELFNVHLSLVQRGRFHKNVSLLTDRIETQLASVYLLNSIILQAHVCDQFVLDCSWWRYCSQYLKLNIPASNNKNQQVEDTHETVHSVDPSEEILLKFMALFAIKAADNKVLITPRASAVEFENRSLLYARMELLSFLQNETDWLLYSIHDSSSSLEKRYKRIGKLNKQGMGLEYEYGTAWIHRRYSARTKKSKKILLDALGNIMGTVRTRGFDCFKFMNWLLYFQQLVHGKISLICRNDTFLLPQILEVTQIIAKNNCWPNENYRDRTLLLWIDIVKEIGAESVLFIFIEKYWYRELSGDCYYAIVTSLEECGRSYQKEQIISLSELQNVVHEEHSPKWFAAFLLMYKHYYLVDDRFPQMHNELQWVVPRLLEMFAEISKPQTMNELPIFLRSCLQIGCYLPVKDYLNSIKLVGKLMFDRTDCVLEMLKIEELVGSCGVGRMLQSVNGYPFFGGVDFALSAYIIQRRLSTEGITKTTISILRQAMKSFLKTADVDTIEGIKLLTDLAKYMDFSSTKNQEEIDSLCEIRNDFTAALRYATNNYYKYPPHLSLELILYASKYGICNSEKTAEYFLSILDRAISMEDSRNEQNFQNTFKQFGDETQCSLMKGFRSRFLYIRKIFPFFAGDIDHRFPELYEG